MTNFVFHHSRIVLDADCTISLEASGQMGPVIISAPCAFCVTKYVYEHEILHANLQPFIDSRMLTIVELDGAEEDTMVNLAAAGLDNGEATAGAVAIHRNWGIGIDDVSARKHFAKYYPRTQLISVVHLVKQWTDIAHPSLDDVRTALRSIENNGRYRPNSQHPLYQWWNTRLAV